MCHATISTTSQESEALQYIMFLSVASPKLASTTPWTLFPRPEDCKESNKERQLDAKRVC